jgi:hypothetical protein
MFVDLQPIYVGLSGARTSRMRRILIFLLLGTSLQACLDSEKRAGSQVDTDGGVVAPGNNAPAITGDPPPQVSSGSLYEFKPGATDVDGDALFFEIENRPDSASIDTTTGRMFGEPSEDDIGVYDDIVILASDAVSTASLPAFSIAEVQSRTGSLTLSWVAPTENSDGSPLIDLAGYTIYYRDDYADYDQQIWINDPLTTQYTIEQLAPATYYFVATAFNQSGEESSISNEVSLTVN